MNLQITARKQYSGFTLIEMLLVLGIIMILFAISTASFSSMKNTMSINETINNISQDFRLAKRSAMFLKRDKDENWLYGIGLDLRQIATNGSYSYFKWCSQFKLFDSNGDVRMNSELPNFNPANSIGTSNGYLHTGSASCKLSDCANNGLCTAGLKKFQFSGVTQISSPVVTKVCGVTNDSNAVDFIVFEAVSGRAIFYDGDGKPVSYKKVTGSSELAFSDNSIPRLYISFSVPDTAYVRWISIDRVSGNVTVDPTLPDNLSTYCNVATDIIEIPKEEEIVPDEPIDLPIDFIKGK